MSLNQKLNDQYLNLHTAKEESFWALYMNHSSSIKDEFEKRELALKSFMTDSDNLKLIKSELERNDLSQWERVGLEGWLKFYQCHSIENPEAIELQQKIIGLEGELGRKRSSYPLGYKDPHSGDFVEAGMGKLLLLVGNDPDEKIRKAAWQAMRDLEIYLLENGYIELVKKRNLLAKKMGYEDFYDYTCQLNEGFSKKELFNILDELKDKTKEACLSSFKAVEDKQGEGSLTPWNIRYYSTGDLSDQIEPYFPFDRALERWGRSFAAMGIDYREADIHIDLVARKGKYENGFMHSPYPSYNDGNEFKSTRINFTANAVPGQLGGGLRAMKTFMHEGGHAAHFSNIDMPSPCFSQEFAPTSGCFAEVQSMIMDSLLKDGDWLWKYAEDREGNKMTEEMIGQVVENEYKFLAFQLRYLAVVVYGEKRIYELSDEDLTSENILKELREAEVDFFGFDCPRPTLAVPHLLAGDSAASYHSYVLAIMGVYHTKDYFLTKYGRLVDNSDFGKEMRDKYWKPGNSRTFLQFLKDMTGKEFSADATVGLVNTPVEKHKERALKAIEEIKTIKSEDQSPIDMNCSIQMVHGEEIISTNEKSFEDMCDKYGAWYKTL